MLRTALKVIRALHRNERGTTLVMMAAALVPILISIGAGLDYSRAYMVRSKLQEAVDSAALAGRRSMVGDDISTAKRDVDAFMSFNFPEGLSGTGPITTNLSKPETGIVRVAATAEMPTTILQIIGINSIPIQVVGEATQNFDNIDIMLVLDTTGSMSDKLGKQRKIDALKDAVKALYAQLEEAQDQLNEQGLRLRIGMLPYASTVNVGKHLWKMSSNHIQTSNVPYYHSFRSRGSWSFGRQQYNLWNYANGAKLGNINGNGDQQDSRWAGCIEERTTIKTIVTNDSREGPPFGAYDVDIDTVPNGATTQWRPYIYDPRNGDVNTSCPPEATPLEEMSKSRLYTLVDRLEARGSTYHDIGMIWGTRMISNGGVFGSQNPDEWGGRPVHRYIIFMTDGLMDTTLDGYSAWGIEQHDKRTGATSKNDSNGRHTSRFRMACGEAKARQVSVWTVAFGTGRVAALDACATNLDQSLLADDSDALIERFAEIGRNIGPLRLSR